MARWGGDVICTRCVMDTSDPEIVFDADGVCHHCRLYDETVKREIHTGEEGRRRLARIAENIKEEGKGREYDCIIGVSGGVDSTYVAYVVKKLGLRPLAVHLDNGWDSELAVKNIENALKILGIDLYTHVIDWDEFKDLQLAFLRASTPDSEIPSDHAILALMHRMADRYRTRYVLPGFNTRTESHLPKEWSQGHSDWRYIKGIHKRFGRRSLKTFPHMDFFLYGRYLLTQRWIKVLNYVDYVKKDAVKTLEKELGWRSYGWKHYESIYTRFYQGYILPRKFGYDKRKMHLSSLVCSGEISRPEALEELKTEPYPADLQEEDRAYIIKKFGLTEKEFDDIMALPPKRYGDYPTNAIYFDNFLFRWLKAGYGFLKDKPSPALG
jgi:N-acetyl sugar amidotransferase